MIMNYKVNLIYSGLEKSAVESSRTSQFSSWGREFSLSLAQWARKEASCQILAIFENYLFEGQTGIQVSFKPCILLKEFLILLYILICTAATVKETTSHSKVIASQVRCQQGG